MSNGPPTWDSVPTATAMAQSDTFLGIVMVDGTPTFVRIPRSLADELPIQLTVANLTPTSGAVVLPASQVDCFQVTLTQNVTSVSVDGWPAAGRTQRCVLYLKQDATGGRSFTGWPSNLLASGSQPLVFTTTPNAIDVFVLSSIDAGATIFVDQVGANYGSITQ